MTWKYYPLHFFECSPKVQSSWSSAENVGIRGLAKLYTNFKGLFIRYSFGTQGKKEHYLIWHRASVCLCFGKETLVFLLGLMLVTVEAKWKIFPKLTWLTTL